MPDFFQEETEPALRSRAEWLDDKLGLDSRFLSKVLKEPEATVTRWINRRSHLGSDSKGIFQEFWYVILHLLSHYNNDEKRVRQLFEHLVPSNAREVPSPLAPPWSGSTLKRYLEDRGVKAVKEVNEWIMSFRFGDPYSTFPKQ